MWVGHFLSDAFEVDFAFVSLATVFSYLRANELSRQAQVKGVGQECPTHTLGGIYNDALWLPQLNSP